MKDTLSTEHKKFLEHYQQYFPAIYRYVSFRIGQRSEVEDVVSEVFLKAVEKYHLYEARPDISFSSWIFKIAKNTLIDYYRKHKRTIVNIEDIGELIDKAILPDTALDRKLIFLKAREIIETLPKKQREIVTMRLFAELKNKEIGEALSISEKTVASTYMRAMQKVSSQINTLI